MHAKRKDIMDRKTYIRSVVSVILNFAVVVLGFIGDALNFGENGARTFQFYTVDSNILAQAACLVCAMYTLRRLADPDREIPAFVRALKYTAVCCITLTFLVVVCILAPMFGGLRGYVGMLFMGSMLFHHLLCPVLAVTSFLFFDCLGAPSRAETAAALIPTGVYAAVTVSLNAARLMTGPYPFLLVYRQPVYMSVIWVIVILGAAILIAAALRALKRAAVARQARAA